MAPSRKPSRSSATGGASRITLGLSRAATVRVPRSAVRPGEPEPPPDDPPPPGPQPEPPPPEPAPEPPPAEPPREPPRSAISLGAFVRHVGPWIAGALVAALVAILGQTLPDESRPVHIAADLSHAGAARIVFSKPLSTTTSPACGCSHAPPGGWEGIVLPARRLLLGRTRDERPTEFDLSSPDPGSWSIAPYARGLRVTVVGYLTNGPPPTTRGFLRTLRRSHNTTTTDILGLTTYGPLHVASLAREPVAALGAPAGVPTEIRYTGEDVPPDSRALTVTTGYAHATGEHGRNSDDAVPMLDVLAPVIVWLRADAGVDYTRFIVREPPPRQLHDGISKTATINTQTTLARPERHGLHLWLGVLVGDSSFALRIAPRPGAVRDTTFFDSLTPDPGRLQVTVPDVVSQGERIVPAFRRATAHPDVLLRHVTFMTDETMVSERPPNAPARQLWYARPYAFRLPPAPPLSGINVFGAFQDLLLRDARGALTVGGQPLQLTARTDFELKDIAGPTSDRDRLLIPLRVNADSAAIHVKGRADARLNETPLAVEPSWIKRFLAPDSVGLVAAIAAALLASVAVLQGRRLRRAGSAGSPPAGARRPEP